MKACNVFLAGALMVGTMAINDPAMAYFRPFSKPGCLGQDRQAMITLTQSQDSVCYLFNPPYPNTVQSAYTDTIISGCVGESPTAADIDRSVSPRADHAHLLDKCTCIPTRTAPQTRSPWIKARKTAGTIRRA